MLIMNWQINDSPRDYGGCVRSLVNVSASTDNPS